MRLDEWLSLTGTTQADLARKLGITPASAQRITTGKQNIPLSLTHKIAEMTDGKVTADDLRAAYVEAREAA